jgi:hypothetical protein
MRMTPSAGTGGACFFRHAHAASGFSQEGQMRPDSVEYTRLELSIHLSGDFLAIV